MFLLVLLVQLNTVVGDDGGEDRSANTCKNAGGMRIFFDEYLPECRHIACADSGNDFKSLRARSPERCQKSCQFTGGCQVIFFKSKSKI